MKARYIRPLKRKNPQWNREAEQLSLAQGKSYPIPQWIDAPPGTIISHPDAWKLVANGDAEPVCDACLAKCEEYFATRGESFAAGFAVAIKQRDRLEKGIHPKHFDAYDEGRMDGYDKKGRPVLKGKLVELEEDQPEEQIVVVIDNGGQEERPATRESKPETL